MTTEEINELLKHEVKFIFVVGKHWVWDYEEADPEVKLFKNGEDAFKYYTELVAEEKRLFDNEFETKEEIEINEAIYRKNELARCDIWRDGYAEQYNTLIWVEKKEVE